MRVRTEEKRQAILETAACAFAELGFERTSMDEIAARVGGSKATLYGYFASKEELFIEVTRAAALQHLAPAFSLLEAEETPADLQATLQRFGEGFMGFVLSEPSVQAMRMVIGESGASSIGRTFYEEGPARGNAAISAFIKRAMNAGKLKSSDPFTAADHLLGLLQSELMWRCLYGVQTQATRQQIKRATERAIAVFLMAYATR